MFLESLASMAMAQFWQLSIVIIFVFLISKIIGKHRPQLTSLLWLVVLIKCVTPPLFACSLSPFCWIQSELQKPPNRISTSISKSDSNSEKRNLNEVPKSLSKALPKALPKYRGKENRKLKDAPPGNLKELGNLNPFAPNVAIDTDLQAMTGQKNRRESHVLRSRNGTTRSNNTHHNQPFSGAIFWLVLWSAGTALCFGWAIFRCWRCSQKIRDSRVSSEAFPELILLFDELKNELRIHRNVELFVSTEQIGPAVFGFWRSKVVLPLSLVNQFTPQQLKPILAHELIHVCRKDLWYCGLQWVAQSIWWFHPLVWLGNRFASREIEKCCDEATVGRLKLTPAEYARGIVRVLESRVNLQPIAAMPGIRAIDLTSRRVERIMKFGNGCRKNSSIVCWSASLLVAIICVPGASIALEETQDDKKTTKNEASKLNPLGDRSREQEPSDRSARSDSSLNKSNINSNLNANLNAKYNLNLNNNLSHNLNIARQDAANKLNSSNNSNLTNLNQNNNLSSEIVARVDGMEITREQLAQACIRKYGIEVLEAEINRSLLEQELKRKKIKISEADLQKEMEETSKKFGLSSERFLEIVQQERGLTSELYRQDILWPSVALKMLVQDSIRVTSADIQQEYDRRFASRVKVLICVLDDRKTAMQVWQMANKNPTSKHFGELARQYSVEPVSKSNNGKVPPIQKTGHRPSLERAAFALRKGEISGLVQQDDDWIVLYCQGQTDPIEKEIVNIRDELKNEIRKKKISEASSELFDTIRQRSQIDNFLKRNQQNQ